MSVVHVSTLTRGRNRIFAKMGTGDKDFGLKICRTVGNIQLRILKTWKNVILHLSITSSGNIQGSISI